MCIVLRRLGHLVEENWDEWFNRVALPQLEHEVIKEETVGEIEEVEGEDEEEETEIVKDKVDEIKDLVEILNQLVGDPFTYDFLNNFLKK